MGGARTRQPTCVKGHYLDRARARLVVYADVSCAGVPAFGLSGPRKGPAQLLVLL